MRHTLLMLVLAWLLHPSAHASDLKSDLARMSWLIGEWTRIDLPADQHGYEHWQAAASGLSGIGVHERGPHRRFEESLSIDLRDGVIHYIAKTPQNSEPIPFRLIELRDNGFVFENRAHDFPKRIEYHRHNDSLSVRISDDDRSVDFLFERSKP